MNPNDIPRKSSSNLAERNKIDGHEEEFRSSGLKQGEGPFLNPNFPEEIIVEILSRVPAKSLGKFKSVSKHWRSLISSTDFIKTHLALASERDDFGHHGIFFVLRAPNCVYHLNQCSVSSVGYPADANFAGATTSAAITELSDLELSDLELSDLDDPIRSPCKSDWGYYGIVGSCDGLVCISVENGKHLFLCNPCSKKCKKLPMKEKGSTDDLFGFGYDKLNDDYKVVGMCRFSPTEVRVYSLKNDSWSRVGLRDCEDVIAASNVGYFAGGNIHWVVRTNGSDRLKYLSFDLASETYGVIEWPSSRDGLGHVGWSIGVLGDCLCVLYDYEEINIDVWVMKEYGVKDSWTKIVSIPCNFPEDFGISLPVCLLSNDDILLIIRSMLVLYSPKSNSFRWYPQVSRVENVGIFVDSLLSPDLSDEEQRLRLNG